MEDKFEKLVDDIKAKKFEASECVKEAQIEYNLLCRMLNKAEEIIFDSKKDKGE